MTELPLKLYLIPGSGTDRRMYAPQLDRFPGIIVPEWLPPLSLKEPLESYAARLAKSIDRSEPFVLGGVSLGGMIAQEMALHLKPQAVILIASCDSAQALPLSRRLAGKATRCCPDSIITWLWNKMAEAVLKTNSRRKSIYAAMLREMPPRLIRWQSGAASEWKLKTRLAMPVFHIHGSDDTIIPLQNVSPGKVINGGHLINATHEHEVNDFLLASMQKAAAAPHISAPQV